MVYGEEVAKFRAQGAIRVYEETVVRCLINFSDNLMINSKLSPEKAVCGQNFR